MRRFIRACTASSALFFTVISSVLAAQLPTLAVPLVKITSPEPALNSIAWDNGALIADFRDVITGEPVQHPARCRVLRTASDLLLRCESFGPMKMPEPDAANVFKGDYFAIALFRHIGALQTAWNFVLSPSGVKQAQSGAHKLVWNSHWRSAVAVTPIGWVAYLEIPRASLTPAGQGDWNLSILNGKAALGAVAVWPYLKDTAKAPMTLGVSAAITER